jgi:hypothetical protein
MGPGVIPPLDIAPCFRTIDANADIVTSAIH